MKIRWRQHELVFVTLFAAIMFGSYLWKIYSATTLQFELPFIQNKVPFNLFRNVILPDIGMGLLIYLAYLFINYFTIPRLWSHEKKEAGTFQISASLKKIILTVLARKILKKYGWLILQIVLITFLLGTALNFAIYFKHQWQFNYPGFSFFPKKGNNPNSMIDTSGSYAAVFFVMGLYAAYLVAREFIISRIESSGTQKAYKILICNEVTLFLVELVLLPFFLISFKLADGERFLRPYFSISIPLFLTFMSNTYWLFPLKGKESFLSKPILFRLLLSTLIFTIPFTLPLLASNTQSAGLGLILSWMVLLFILTPISWLVYQQRKDKLLELRGTQKALVKSKANLQFLRSQINPHFLFNVLNTLYGTALQENAALTAGGIQQLGDMMRFMLHENNLDFIEMNREIDYLENYISLQKLRTQSSPEIIIEDNINGQQCNHQIAPMLLIPLVENAFKHGISLKEKSWIKIKLDCNENNIHFEVRNSMHTRQVHNMENERSGIGFKNVLQRLKLIYPGKFQIVVNDDGKEFFVNLSIQL
jgi:two-component system, LytTR family, sensor kinase